MEGNIPKRVKVVIVINDLLLGGAQDLAVDLVTKLNPEKFEAELLVLFHFGGTKNEYLYHKLPAHVRLHQLYFKGFIDPASWIKLVRVIRTINPDIVLAHLFFTNTVMRLLKPFFHFRVITVEHNTYTKKPKLHQWLDRVLAQFSSRIVAVSETVVDFTSKQENIKRDKFVVINGGIDMVSLQKHRSQSDIHATRRLLNINQSDHAIVNISRIVPQKNHQLLIDGFTLFARDHPTHHLIVVGAGSHLEKIRSYAVQAGLGNRIQFLGYQKDIIQFLAVADFFVSTSLIEGFGITHAEALACGVPVLSTRTAGPDEMIVEGVNGFFIDDYTPKVVAEGMTRMINADLASMRKAAPRSVEHYSLDRAIRNYEQLFENVLAK